MKKGFTLIELLAVIVILAIIALIATPMILGVIDSAKKGAAENSTYGYIDAIEKSDLKNMIDTENYTARTDGTYDLSTLANVSYKGQSPTAVCVIIKDGNVENGSFQFDNYIVDYSNGKAKVNTTKAEVSCEPTTSPEEILFNEAKGVNIPKLSEGMTPIKWVNGVETVTTVDDPEWYDYAKQLWANVKTADGSYFVWIPRYAYKITSGYHSSEVGSIDVKFLKGTSDTPVDNTNIETTGYVVGNKDTSMYYFTHPAFQNDINETGYWVAKFEPTAVEGVANGYTVDHSCLVEDDDVLTKTVQVIPNAKSWRCINIANAYKTTIAMKNKTTAYGWHSDEVDTHMMTNLEWGAISYLSQSVYGTNGNEIYINNSQTYTTGCAGNTVSASAYNGCQNPYNTETGVKASTTQNITGIYDMSGGAWESIMGVYNNLITGSGFTEEEMAQIPTNYITKYQTALGNMLNGVGMDYDMTVYGDGIYEMSEDANRYNGSAWIGKVSGSWNADYSNLPYTTDPWLYRGAYFGHTTNAGIVAFSSSNGRKSAPFSFRPIVSVIK